MDLPGAEPRPKRCRGPNIILVVLQEALAEILLGLGVAQTSLVEPSLCLQSPRVVVSPVESELRSDLLDAQLGNADVVSSHEIEQVNEYWEEIEHGTFPEDADQMRCFRMGVVIDSDGLASVLGSGDVLT
jgi:hypothetical protein